MWPVNWASYLSRRAGNHEGRVQCPSLCHARLAPCARQAEDDPAFLIPWATGAAASAAGGIVAPISIETAVCARLSRSTILLLTSTSS
jgi:hypothetical protein